jgi:hypothetical protein
VRLWSACVLPCCSKHRVLFCVPAVLWWHAVQHAGPAHGSPACPRSTQAQLPSKPPSPAVSWSPQGPLPNPARSNPTEHGSIQCQPQWPSCGLPGGSAITGCVQACLASCTGCTPHCAPHQACRLGRVLPPPPPPLIGNAHQHQQSACIAPCVAVSLSNSCLLPAEGRREAAAGGQGRPTAAISPFQPQPCAPAVHHAGCRAARCHCLCLTCVHV